MQNHQPGALEDRKTCRVPGCLQIYHHKIQKLCLCLGPMVCYRGQAMILPENQAIWDNQTRRVYIATFPVTSCGWWDSCRSCGSLNIFFAVQNVQQKAQSGNLLYFLQRHIRASLFSKLPPACTVQHCIHRYAQACIWRRGANRAQPTSYASKSAETRHSHKLISCFPTIPSYPIGLVSFWFCS